MKTKKAPTMPFKHLRSAMLTDQELIDREPQFKNLKPAKRAKLIEFVYELSLVLYNSHSNTQGFKTSGT